MSKSPAFKILKKRKVERPLFLNFGLLKSFESFAFSQNLNKLKMPFQAQKLRPKMKRNFWRDNKVAKSGHTEE